MAEALLGVLPRVAEHWELIIVDDGSRDRTAERAAALARVRANVRVVRHAVQRGYGAAIRSGLAAARHEYVFVTDGDRQFDPTQIRRLMAGLERADVAVGYRPRRADPLVRRLYGAAWNALMRRLFALSVRDINCAFKLLPARAVAGAELRAEGAIISTELLVCLRQRGYTIVEVPVDHFPRRAGRASGGDLRVMLRAGRELLALRRRLRPRARLRAGSTADVVTVGLDEQSS